MQQNTVGGRTDPACRIGDGGYAPPINARVDLVLEDVLRLSAEEPSAVVAALIVSLETGDEESVADAWRTELLRRRRELRAGQVQAAPWSLRLIPEHRTVR